MKISAIIVTYNRPDALEVILNSILQQSEIPHEVVIADDGSEKETLEIINNYRKDFPCSLKHVWHEDKGFRAAEIRNKAIKKSTGDYLFFSDGDLFYHSNFFRDLKKNLEPNIALIGSRVFLKKENTREILLKRKAEYITFISQKIDKNRLNAIRIPFITSFFPPQNFSENLRGGLLCISKENIVAINGWNEDFTGWGKEDTELVARLWYNGVTLKKLKFSAITYHLWHPELSRKRIKKNEEILSDCMTSQKTWCKNGLFKHEMI